MTSSSLLLVSVPVMPLPNSKAQRAIAPEKPEHERAGDPAQGPRERAAHRHARRTDGQAAAKQAKFQ
jgi:hypothetical protein